MDAQEWQFDGLVGPTHNYAGLAFGNVASDKNAGLVSNPKLAALQGLEKMRFVRSLGLPQAFFPPQKRPVVTVLQQLGFGAGKSREAVAKTIDDAAKAAPHLLASVFSSSFMWAANAATVSPSADTMDGRVHFTPANLTSHLHRSLEAASTMRLFKTIFHNESLFTVHNPLPATVRFSDEGAANHMRTGRNHAVAGVEYFVYGAPTDRASLPGRFPARQQQEACEAIIRSHQLKEGHYCLVQQSPEAIDQGVFHNDVIAMNTTSLMVIHEKAFSRQPEFIVESKRLSGPEFQLVEIPDSMLSVVEAVGCYLFNSQLLALPNGKHVLVAPGECERSAAAQDTIKYLMHECGAISEVFYLDVRESMRNGGGPACLRLRVVLTPEEEAAMHSGIIIDELKIIALQQWVDRHYRDRLSADDLRDINFITELNSAYEALETLVGMPGLYSE